MNDILNKLPIGIQTFEKLITGGYIYIDKTALISKLASSEVPCLFTRPRSFICVIQQKRLCGDESGSGV